MGMRTWAFLCLVSLLSSGLEGASLSYQHGSDFSFAQNGIQIDLSLKDKVNPLVGGTVHVELPIGEIWKILETGNTLLKPMETYLETLNLGKVYEVYIKPLVVYLESTPLGKVFNTNIKPLVEYLMVLSMLLLTLHLCTRMEHKRKLLSPSSATWM